MRLQLELVQLLTWSTQLGFAGPDRTPSLFLKADQAVILNVLVQQHTVLDQFLANCVEQKASSDSLFPSSSRLDLERSWRRNLPDHRLVNLLVNAQDSKPETVIHKFPESLHTDASQLQGLVKVLAEFNNELYLLLEPQMKIETGKTHHKLVMRTLIMYSAPLHLASFVQALREFSIAHPVLTSPTEDGRHVDFASIAQFKLLNEALDYEYGSLDGLLQQLGIEQSRALPRKLKIDRTSIDLDGAEPGLTRSLQRLISPRPSIH